jgi:hypothetical protein
MELFAETARAAAPDTKGGIEIRSLQVQQGIVLSGEPAELIVHGRPAGGKAREVLSMEIRSSEPSGRSHYRADVAPGDRATPRASAPGEPTGLEPFPLSVQEAYRQWLFQGPCFAGITEIQGIGRNTITGVLQSVPPSTCLHAGSSSRWLIDPTVVDASLQLVILWERHWHNMTPLPMQIDRFCLYRSLSTQPVLCRVQATTTDAGESLTADIHYTDPSGQPLAVLEGLQCACTRELNRLSDATVHELSSDSTRQPQGAAR